MNIYTVKYLFIHVFLQMCKINFRKYISCLKVKISYILEEKKQGDFSYIFEACCSLGITYDNDNWYHMFIISLKGKLCLCSVNRPLYNLSAFELVFMAWNLDSDSYNRVLPWFPVQPILPHRNQPRCCISWIFPIASGFTSLTYFIRTHKSPRKRIDC